MKHLAKIAALIAALCICAACGKAPQSTNADTHNHDHAAHADHDHDHDHAAHEEHDHDHEHEHDDETPLGTFTIGDLQIEAAQGHGAVEAGKENHLVVKLPYNDKGATVVRAWIGGEDRTLSTVGKAEFEADHGDYLVHAIAPTPLPDGAQWWLEVEKPDGTKAVGSFPFK